MKTISVIPHTHWDREWYFTHSDNIVLLDFVFKEIIKELQNNSNQKFCFDGQISVLRDFLKINPHYTETIKRLTADKRIEIGPWFTQSDCLNVNGESICRNLYYGITLSNELGRHMNVAYLPDSFGFNAQIPTIVKNFKIDNLILRRGFSYKNHVSESFFKWEGQNNNKEVYALHIYGGYGPAYLINSKDDYQNQKLNPFIEEICKYNIKDNVLLGSGGDQTTININLDKKLNELSKGKYNFKISTYEQYFNEVEKDNLKKYQGEFRDSELDRVHRTIGSIRIKIKNTIDKAEQHILYETEPLMLMGKSLGIDISNNLIYEAWELLFESQAHDSCGGCVTDDVAKEIILRNEKALQISEGISNIIKKKMSEMLDLNENEVLIFNTNSKYYEGKKQIKVVSNTRNIKINNYEYEIIECQNFSGKKDLLIEGVNGNYYVNEDPYFLLTVNIWCKLEPLSYKVISFNNIESVSCEEKNDKFIENDYYKISLKNNKPCIHLKESNIDIVDFIYLKNCGNDGDTYDFSPLEGDREIDISFVDAKFKTYNLSKKAIFSCYYKIPLNLEDRITNNSLENIKFTLEVELSEDNNITCNVSFDNKVNSHRMQVCIKTIDGVFKNISTVPFGYIERKNEYNSVATYDNYVEKPLDNFPMDDMTSLTSSSSTMYVYSKYCKEYGYTQNEIKLTMFSTTNEFGKANLAIRPGRASGDTTKKGHVQILTPLAQERYIHNLEFTVVYTNRKFEKGEVSTKIEELNFSSVYYQRQMINKFINRLDNKIVDSENIKKLNSRSNSFFKLENDLIISSYTPILNDDKSFVICLKNMTDKKIDLAGYDICDFKGDKDNSNLIYPNDFGYIKYKIKDEND